MRDLQRWRHPLLHHSEVPRQLSKSIIDAHDERSPRNRSVRVQVRPLHLETLTLAVQVTMTVVMLIFGKQKSKRSPPSPAPDVMEPTRRLKLNVAPSAAHSSVAHTPSRRPRYVVPVFSVAAALHLSPGAKELSRSRARLPGSLGAIPIETYRLPLFVYFVFFAGH